MAGVMVCPFPAGSGKLRIRVDWGEEGAAGARKACPSKATQSLFSSR